MNSLVSLRAAALLAAIVGAVIAVGLTLYAGRHNKSLVLMMLFAIWVLSPFVALLAATLASDRWTVSAQAMLYMLMLVIALGTVTSYGVIAFGPPRQKTATVFVLVPPLSWLLLALLGVPAVLRSRRSSNVSD